MSYEIDALLLDGRAYYLYRTIIHPSPYVYLSCSHLYISYAKGIVSKCPSSHRLAKEGTIRTPIHPCGELRILRILLASSWARRIQTKSTIKGATAKRKPIHAVLMSNAKMVAAARNGAGAARRQPTAANVASPIVMLAS